MPPDDAFQSLWTALHSLRDGVRALCLTVGQDHPPVRALPQPVRRATEDVEDLLGALQEAIAAVGLDTPRICHERLIAMARATSTGIAAPERLEDLANVARDRDVGWHRWHASVLDGLARYHEALWDAHTAAVSYWDSMRSTPPVRRRVPQPVSQTEED